MWRQDGGAGLLLLLPVEDEEFLLQGVQELAGGLLDLDPLGVGQIDGRFGQEVEDGQLFFGQALADVALVLVDLGLDAEQLLRRSGRCRSSRRCTRRRIFGGCSR
ncbi:MAG: hypothetical protein R3A46_15420 [Thermomicrobiales bacterium]